MSMKKIILPALLAATLFSGCKSSDDTPAVDFNTLKGYVLSDFVNKVAIPGYTELQAKGTTLNTAIITLNTTADAANLAAARLAWKDMRSTWEKTEGFLFGPVEDDEYDPDTDTWPVNFNDMDALLAGAQPLGVSDIDALPRALKGYHPIEYILWGQGGTQTAGSLTARQKEYMVSLSANLKQKADALYNSWNTASLNYGASFINAAAPGNSLYPTKQAAFLTMTEALLAICGEVGDGKMREPYDAMDPQIVESPFSANSTIDFKNNIIGAYNVYLGKFNEDGYGLEDLVKSKNSSLDQTIKQKFEAAIGSFDAITIPYEQAIISQRPLCLATMTAINNLAATIDTDLRTFITTNITD